MTLGSASHGAALRGLIFSSGCSERAAVVARLPVLRALSPAAEPVRTSGEGARPRRLALGAQRRLVQ